MFYIKGLIDLFEIKYTEKQKFFSRKHCLCFRGIAAIIIMIQHIAGGYGITYFTPLGGVGVAMFLVASGYGVNESYKSKGINNYWKKKIFYIFIPYITTFILVIVMNNIPIIKNYMIIPVYWYLSFILLQYILYYIYVKVKFLNKNRELYWIIINICILIFFNEIKAEQALSFYTGILISDNYEKIKKLKSKSIIYLFLIGIGICFFIIKQFPFIRSFYGTCIFSMIQLLIKLPVALGIILLSYNFKKIYYIKIFEYIGKLSLMFYLVHMAFLPLIKLTRYSVINLIIYFIVVLFISNALNSVFISTNYKKFNWRIVISDYR